MLFTIELLRSMQSEGNCSRTMRQVDGASMLDWGLLPARVRQVIEERSPALDSELQKILSVASVEGEIFITQVG